MPDQLKFGLSGINGRVTSYPEALVQLAQAAESAGFEFLWAGEHIILPESRHACQQPHAYSILCSRLLS